MDTETLLKLVVHDIQECKARDITIINLEGLSGITDYFVVCTVDSVPQMKSVYSGIDDDLRKNHKHKTIGKDGNYDSKWIVLDYGDVIVHIFHKDLREIYDLESLWGDAPIKRIVD